MNLKIYMNMENYVLKCGERSRNQIDIDLRQLNTQP